MNLVFHISEDGSEIELLQLVHNLQQAGKIHKFHNLQQVCGISGCVCYANIIILVNQLTITILVIDKSQKAYHMTVKKFDVPERWTLLFT